VCHALRAEVDEVSAAKRDHAQSQRKLVASREPDGLAQSRRGEMMELCGVRYRSFVRLAVVAMVLPLMLSACRSDGGRAGSQRASVAADAGSGNRAPSISGSPGSTVGVGKRYTFVPAATDPEGLAVGFSITNRPAWAQFDTATGRLSGTPTAGDLGHHANIVITASDGQHSSALAPFAIEVTPADTSVSNSVQLSWSPPTENIDGSVLTDLAGYEILYGRAPETLDQTIKLTNSSLSIYIVENLAPGTWYFAIVAINAGGTTSPPSGVVSKTIS
jgi:hypothetical protein